MDMRKREENVREREARRLFESYSARRGAVDDVYSQVEEKEGGGGDGDGGRHTGSVVNEQSFEPNMLSPRRRSPYSSCQGAAHVRPRRFPVCQTGKPGQTFELAQTVWYPTTIVVASEKPANS